MDGGHFGWSSSVHSWLWTFLSPLFWIHLTKDKNKRSLKNTIYISIQSLHSLQALSLPSWQRRNEGGPLLSLAWPIVNLFRLIVLEVSLLPCLPLGLATLPSSGPPLLSHIILSSFLSPFAISILTSEWDILVWKLYKHKTLLKFTCFADIIWAEIFLVSCWCMIYDDIWLILHCMYETLVLWPGPD